MYFDEEKNLTIEEAQELVDWLTKKFCVMADLEESKRIYHVTRLIITQKYGSDWEDDIPY